MKKVYSTLLFLGTFAASFGQTTLSFTGSMQTFTVPVGVTSLLVDASGGRGGGISGAYTYQSNGGGGGRVSAVFAVTPGHTLNVYVGGAGNGDDGTGGYGGGGNDYGFISWWPGAGGGGATLIVDATSGDTLLFAGGGGGGGGYSAGTDNGGAGGGIIAASGVSNPCTIGGGGGSSTAGGTGEYCYGYVGSDGMYGIGGDADPTDGSGGGGGGYYGGGGGSYGGGGGGGSSYTNALFATSVSHFQGYNTTGDGVVTLTPLFPCSGTVSAGSVSSSAMSGGLTSSFTLSLSGATVAAGLTYQWQSSPDGVTYTDVSGATSATYTFTGIAANVYYQCIVTCPSSSSTATSSSLMLSYMVVPTCFPSSSSWGGESGSVYYGGDAFYVAGYGGTTLDDFGMTSVADGSTGYLDRTSIPPVQFQQSGVYAASVTWGISSSHQYLQTWIDFNDDGTFQASEEVSPVSGYPVSQPTAFNISIPSTAPVGNHLMRMRAIWEYNWTDIGTAPDHVDPCLIEYGGSFPEYYSGDIVDYQVTIVSLPPCSGTVTGGSAVSTSPHGDGTTTFTLSLSGATTASGLTYDWQSSPDGTTWTDIPGATDPTYTFTGISANTYFQCIVTCPASSSTATSGSVMLTYMLMPVCTTTSSSWSSESGNVAYGANEFAVSGFSGSSLDDVGIASLADGTTGYLDHTSLTPLQMQQSGVYATTLTWGNASSDQLAQVWIDFNDNGTYETSEEVSPVSGYSTFSTPQPTLFDISIPITANPGAHLMRVRAIWELMYTDLGYAPTDIDPCLNEFGFSYPVYYSGDVVDYMVTIVPLPPCSGTVSAGTAVVTPPVGGIGTTFALSLTGASAASDLTYVWQSSPDGSTWTNIPGGTTPVYSFTGISANTYFQCIVTCPSSSSTATSVAAMATYALTPTCFPTAASWASEAYNLYYGSDALYVNGFGGTIIDDAGMASAANPTTGYLDRTTMTPVQFQQSGSYASSLTWGISSSHQYMQAWIDFNNNGTFETSEEVTPVSGYPVSQPTTFNIDIPLTADTGSHLMRVRSIWEYNFTDIGSAPSHMDPCLIEFGGVYPQYYSGVVADYMVSIVPLPPCSGTPVAGSATASASSVCLSTTFDLNYTGVAATGLTYQWQSSPDGISWTDMVGVTTVPYTASETASTYYRVYVTCGASGLSDTSAGVHVGYIPYCYCIPSYYYTSPSNFDALANFSLTGYGGSSINDDGPATPPASGYVDESSTISVDLQQGGSYPGSITYSSYWQTYEDQVWIDFNDNGSFETSEEVTPDFGVTGCSTYGSSATYTLTIPLTATPGSHRMRVRQAETYNCTVEPDMDPCNYYSIYSGETYYYGETRDYTANIIALPMCSGTPDAGIVSATTTTGCSPYPSVLSDAGYTAASGLTYQWQSSADGVTWLNVGGATSTTYSPIVTATTYVRFGVICTASGLTGYSAPVTLDMTPNPGPISLPGGTPGGPFAVCYTDTVTFAGAASGGSWSYSNPSLGILDPSTGVWTSNPVSVPGTTTISYSIASCTAVATLNVNSFAPAAPYLVSGSNPLCAYSSLTLGDATMGGVWLSSSASVATVDPLGHVTGTGSGTTTILYNDGCGSSSFSVTVNGSAISLTPADGQICFGATADLTATLLTDPGSSYSWSGPAGVSTTTALTITAASVSDNGIYTFVATTSPASGSCIESVTLPVSIRPVPMMTVTPTSPSVCSGSSVSLSATSILAPSDITILAQNFNSGMTGQVGGDWSVLNLGDASSYNWSLVAPYDWTDITIAGDGTNYIGTNADAAGSSVTLNTFLYSPVFSTVGYPAVTLSFNHYIYSNSSYDYTAEIDYTTDGGSTWNVLQDYYNLTDGATSWDPATPTHVISLPAAAIGQPSVQLAWHYYSNWGFYWAVDNVRIGGTALPATYSWTGVGSATGLSCTACSSPTITPIAAGSNVYSVTATSGSCSSSLTDTITVYPSPAPISGVASVCLGSTSTLSNTVPGGTWSIADASIATVDPSTGVLSGVATGSTTVTYTIGVCSVTAIVNVGTAGPAVITGIPAFCVGSTTTLHDSVAGGTWVSGMTSVATVNPVTGVVSGIAGGVAMISYTTGCGSPTTITVTVTPGPASITGTFSECVGSSVTLTDATPGGTWSSAAPAIAVAGSTDGVILGITPGVTTITYTEGCGQSVASFTVNGAPAAITGSGSVCVAGTTSLSDITVGGLWSSGATTIATINSAGVVSGITAGTAPITYTTGCGSATTTITVNGAPVAISGSSSLCAGGTTTLSDATSGGTWTSASGAVATVDALTGVVSGMAPGGTTISYTTSCGSVTQAVTVNSSLPASITGLDQVCQGGSVTLSDVTFGGSWISATPSVATITAGGVLSGVSGGTVLVSYSTGCGIPATTTVTVNPTPSVITGVFGFCAGSTTTLFDSVSGGTWSTTATVIATVDPVTGIVSGLTPGTAAITYTNSCGSAIRTVTVNTGAPAAIAGVGSVCAGSTITLSDVVTGGNWTSGSTSVATAGSSSGVISGVAAGTVNITYSTGCGAPVVKSVTVNPLPAAITGTATICATGSATLSDAVSGGTWSSASTSVATIDAVTGVMSGVSGGTTTISYTTASCGSATLPVTITGAPASITGGSTVCIGGTSILHDVTPGGTWSSSATAILTINPTLGIATGISAGSANVTYTTTCGSSVMSLTVNGSPASITGVNLLCIGTTATLTDVTPGGTWLSDAPAIVSVGTSSGIMNGLTAGVAIVTYTNGCGVSTSVVTVNNSIAISGPSTACVAGTATLTDAATGGTWSSSDNAVATIGSSSGSLSGVAPGVVTITYNSGSYCGSAFTQLTIVGAPASIAGTTGICVSTTTTLTNTTVGGAWSSSSTGVATVNAATGVVGGVSAGSTIITYNTGCGVSATQTVNVLGNPAAISGSSAVCVSGSATLSETALGGIWSSSDISLATVSGTPAAGIVSGLGAGNVTITYSNGCGTAAVYNMTVVGPPAAISGPGVLYPGCHITLADATAGGVWGSSIPGTASIDGSTGIVTGNASGTTTITYLTTCGFATSDVTVNTTPPAIHGTNVVCVGASTSLTDSSLGGAWSCGSPSLATVNSAGVVTGTGSGVAVITYDNGCGVHLTYPVTVNPSPAPIGGFTSLCQFTSDTLTDAVSAGTWSTSDVTIATIDPTSGVFNGVGYGSVTVTYELSNNCLVTRNIGVNPYPNAGIISGPDSVCIGAQITLTDTSGGGLGSWTSGTPAVLSASGPVITALTNGSAIINYTVSNLCGSAFAHFTVGVKPLPDPGAISGTASFCAGATTTLADDVPGGAWSLAAGINATIDADGVVTGVTPGTDTAIYTVNNVCGPNSAVLSITVLTVPVAITGATSVCNGNFTFVTDSSLGGTWSSSDLGTATIDAGTGEVTGVGVGPVTISYTGCGVTVTTSFIVNAMPNAGTITGADSMVCAGSSITFSNTATGGTWSSGNESIAVMDTATGVLTAVSTGADTVIYTVNSASCGSDIAIRTITVNPLPVAGLLMGTDSVCVGGNVTITPSQAGGSWSFTNGTAETAAGVVTGISAGNDTLVYTVSSAYCGSASASISITVLPLPIAGTITGATTICIGSPVTLTDAAPGGVWTNGSSAVDAVVNGVVTGLSTGADSIWYSVTNSCGTANTGIAIQVLTLPDHGVITGADSMCKLATVTLANAVSGGSWSSSNTSIASIGSTGALTASATGLVTVYYSVSNVCGTDSAMKSVLVLALPDSNTLAATTVCVGATFVVADTALGFTGTWTSTNPSVATISGDTVTAVAQGVDTVHYVVNGFCGVSLGTAVLTVDSVPVVEPITGTSFVCLGTRDHLDSLACATAGGVWSSSSSMNPITTSGVLTGNSAGPDTVSYTVTNGVCAAIATKIIMVYTKDQCDSVLDVKSVVVKDGLIRVYPNPNTGSFTVVLPDESMDATITVLDICGKILETRNVPAHTVSESQFDFSSIARGTYMIRVEQGERTYRGKMLVIE